MTGLGIADFEKGPLNPLAPRKGDPGKPAAIDDRNLGIMRCLEFYESSRLKTLVAKSR
jgi:hypothetical protein